MTMGNMSGVMSGVLGSVLSPAGLAQISMGPPGWASLAAQTIGSQIGLNVLQQLGEKMGLPQPVIDLAQAAFGSAIGQPGLARENIGQAVSGFTKQMNLSPSEAGRLTRELEGTADKSMANLQKIVETFAKKLLEGPDGGEKKEEGGSILLRIARALGALMDQKMEGLAAKSEELGKLGGESKLGGLAQPTTGGPARPTTGGPAQPTTGNTTKDGNFTAQGNAKFGSLSAEVQALSQEIGYLSQAISSTIKSIGEATSAIARK